VECSIFSPKKILIPKKNNTEILSKSLKNLENQFLGEFSD